MFSLTEGQIMNLCGGGDVYSRGKEYYEHSRVKALKFDSTINGFVSIVSGRRKYKIKTYFDAGGHFDDASCTCPAYKTYMGYCKHIVAVLLAIKNHKGSRGKLLESRRKTDIQNLIQHFSYGGDGPKTPLHLEINYELAYDPEDATNLLSQLHFRLGEEKLYVMKSPRSLIHHLMKDQPLEYGKAFTYVPSKHTFKKEDQPLIEMIQEKVEEEQMAYISSWGQSRNSIFQGKYMLLSPTTLKRFFRMMGQRKFHAHIDGVTYKDVQILEEDLPLAFMLKEGKENMLLEMLGDAKIQALTQDGSYYFYEGNIYSISPKQQKYFTPLYHTLIQEEKNPFISLQTIKRILLARCSP